MSPSSAPEGRGPGRRTRPVGEQSITDRIEKLVAEEHRLWRTGDGAHDGPAHERLEAVRRELDAVRRQLDRAYTTLRRRRAGQPDVGPADRDVPWPPNDLEGPEPEPPHSDHGVHVEDSAGGDPAPNSP